MNHNKVVCIKSNIVFLTCKLSNYLSQYNGNCLSTIQTLVLIDHRRLLWSYQCFCYCQHFELPFTRQYKLPVKHVNCCVNQPLKGTLVIWLFWSLPKFQITFYQTNFCVKELWKCSHSKALKMISSPFCEVSALQCLWVDHTMEWESMLFRYEPLTVSLRLFNFFSNSFFDF